MKSKFSSSDQSTLKQYYKSCAKEALKRGDKREHKKYVRLIEEMEGTEKDINHY